MSAAPALPPKAGSPPILLCQVPGIDIKSRANSTSDSSSALSLLARLNSLLSRKNSLLWLQKFPVPSRRESGCKPLNRRADWVSKSAAKRQKPQNSLLISLLYLDSTKTREAVG